MDRDQIKSLIEKYNAGTANSGEIALLETWYLNYNSELKTDLSVVDIQFDVDQVRVKLARQIRPMSVWPRVAVAASIMLLLSFGGYYLIHKRAEQQSARNLATLIKPGGNKAILTLANGKRIILDNIQNGEIAQQGNASITKTARGDVQYVAGSGRSNEVAYNTMATPRGGQYHLTLSDGTNVWLNAASSIKFPTVFNGANRKVEITGEAYFEVAHNKVMPFRVSSGSQMVEVLGTHFNINAYNAEPAVKTTLLEGSVKVTSGSNSVVIKPGQQASLANNELAVYNADTEEAIAWKDGMFRFTDEKLESIMRKISRWYDVDVEYADSDVKNIPFNGIITHFGSANQVLRMLERTKQVQFKIEGKKIIVMK
ncbi:MAG: FecR family protein [Mucilaginibacter sp.]|uniref:FecR family protein n=1 Tax=Mucilaginibacter sp. TaxID=1882438 RepID=UPI0034E38FBA